jgi:hypothetical protein
MRIDNAAASESQGKLTYASLGLRLRQDCRFKRFVSYLHVAYDALISERNYPTSGISKYNFLRLLRFCNFC